MQAIKEPQTVGIDPALVETGIIECPLDWVLVRLDARMEASLQGVLVPTKSRPEARMGVVIAHGQGSFCDDGKTRLPMHARVGDRILFEPSAGKGLPRCARETSETEWGYRLLRDGSICATVRTPRESEHRQKALDDGAAGTPPRPLGGPPVSRYLGALKAEDLSPLQDWCIIRTDVRRTETDAPRPSSNGNGIAKPEKLMHLPGGKAKRLAVVEANPEETYDLWTGVVLARGPGLLTTTRCIDGDRIGIAPHMCEVGDRVFFRAEAPWVAPIYDYAPMALGGVELLVREYPSIHGKIIEANA